VDFQFKLGMITKPRSIVGQGNMFGVRIVPDMQEIQDTSLLPFYPNFLKEQDYAYQIDDMVWCLTNDDFTVGFILGLSQGPAGSSIESVIKIINTAEVEAGFPQSGYNDLSVLRFAGTSIQYYNVSTGYTGQIFNNKAVFLTGADGSIWVKNSGFQMQVTATGDINLKGKSRHETLTEQFTTISRSVTEDIKGSVKSEIGGAQETLVAGSIRETSGANINSSSIGDRNDFTLGKHKETIGNGSDKIVVKGNVDETVALGNYNLTVVAGVANLTVLGGALNVYAGLGLKLSSTVAIDIAAPIINLPLGMASPTGAGNPATFGGFNALPFCLFTGVPHSTNVLVGPTVVLPPVDPTSLVSKVL